MPRRTKSPQVNFLVSPDLYKRATQAAKLADKSFSEWCRDALREKAERESASAAEFLRKEDPRPANVSPGEGVPGQRG